MLHLITGANGTGKTLFTLKWVRERQQKENRPVYYNGRFALKPEIQNEFGWQKFEFKEWQNLPDGSICIVDECHNDIPPRNQATTPPNHIAMLAEHRRRGFDFYLMTQHPKNVDAFVTRLIGSPGWHRHLKRLAGATPVVRMLQWDAVDKEPERMTAKNSADGGIMHFPKEVYNWYDSAVMHTGKVRVPRKLYLFFVLLALCIFLFWWAFADLAAKGELSTETTSETSTNLQPIVPPVNPNAPITTAEYIASYKPRIDGLPHTAPRYDEVTRPVTAPRPAGCMLFRGACKCYTQQGTPMTMPDNICMNILKNGFFQDWPSDPGTAHIQQRENRPIQEPLT